MRTAVGRQIFPADGIGRTSKPAAGEGEPADRRARQRAKRKPTGLKWRARDLYRRCERGTEAPRPFVHRLSRLACEASRCRLRFLWDRRRRFILVFAGLIDAPDARREMPNHRRWRVRSALVSRRYNKARPWLTPLVST